jgi:RNA polymerase sigma-70 factor (ECF subfamily)
MSRSRTDPQALETRTSDREELRLLQRLRARDRAAFAELFDAQGKAAFGVAYRMLHDAREAEDAVQEAFVSLWRQAQSIDPARGNVRSLLLTIVHRRAIDTLRRRAGRPVTALDDADQVRSVAPDPLEQASEAEERARVRAAMEGLPADQREAIELTYFGGLTVTEMAERQRVPVGTAKSRLRLGLERMRRTLVSR